MTTIQIDNEIEYTYLVQRGYQPLTGFAHEINLKIVMPNQLRKELQDLQFPNLDKFYRFCFDFYGPVCQETGLKLPIYSAAFVSHILSRGAHPAMAKDPRNVNILCKPAHDMWEYGDRQKMKIYRLNNITMQELKLEYYA